MRFQRDALETHGQLARRFLTLVLSRGGNQEANINIYLYVLWMRRAMGKKGLVH